MDEQTTNQITALIENSNIFDVDALLKIMPAKLKGKIFWGATRREFKLGYYELRKVLPANRFSILSKAYPQMVFRTENKLTAYKLHIETAMDKRTGLLNLSGPKPLFIRRIFDTKTKKENGGSMEVIEWRRYINAVGDPLADLRTTVLTGLALIRERFVCSQCLALSQYQYQTGFVCINCRAIVNPTYQKWEQQKLSGVKL